MATVFTIDIGGTKCAAALTDADGVSFLKTWPTTGATENLKIALDHFHELPTEVRNQVQAIGVCFGGPVNFAAKKINRSVHVPGWEDFDFGQWAQHEFALPIVVDNDANIGAIAEFQHGQHNTQNLIYITISTGIGAGVISSGRVIRGNSNDAGELGHLRVADTEKVCSCGRTGCLERMCSGYWLEQDFHDSPINLFKSDDFLAQYAKNFATGLASAVLLYNPEVVILGGGVSRVGTRLTDAISSALITELGSWQHLAPRLTISTFDSAGVHLGVQALTSELLS